MMGMVSTAMPEDEEMKKDSPAYSYIITLAKRPLGMPCTALLA